MQRRIVDNDSNKAEPPDDQTPPASPHSGEADEDWSSSQAVQAALALATRHSDEAAPATATSEGDTHETLLLHTAMTEEHLALLLKRQSIRARWAIRENAVAFLERRAAAEATAHALRLVPFDGARLIDAPIGLREALVILLSQIILLHLSQMSRPSHRARRLIANWSTGLLDTTLKLLQLDPSPAQATISEAVEAFRDYDPQDEAASNNGGPFIAWFARQRRRRKENSAWGTSTIQELINPQPAKWNFLKHCETALQAAVSTAYDRAISTEGLLEDRYPTRVQSSMPSPTVETRHVPAPPSLPTMFPPAGGETPRQPRTPSRAAPPPCPAPPTVVIRDLLLMLVLTNRYDARTQAVFDVLSQALDAQPLGVRLAVEDLLLHDLTGSMDQERTESPRTRTLRRLKVAGVAVGLGALTALTAGLAAPAIAAGFGALGIAGTSGAVTFLATAGGSATVASVFGAGTAGLTGWKYSRRIGKIKVFKFDRLLETGCYEREQVEPATEVTPSATELEEDQSSQDTEEDQARTAAQREEEAFFPVLSPRQSRLSLSVTICISGWLRRMSDIWVPWREVARGNLTNVYTLRWDPQVLLDLGSLVVTMLSQKFAVSAAQLWLQTTVAGALSTALMWPVAVLQYASTLDNAWMSCRERAMQAGRLLAEALCDRKTIGARPVSLMGFSMGARVVFACLLELHRREAFHIVSDVVLMGAPISCDKGRWQQARDVISGRLINVYAPTDWLLGFLYRYMEWGVRVAGLSPVKVQNVENVDASGIVRSHSQYADRLADVLALAKHHAIPEQREVPLP